MILCDACGEDNCYNLEKYEHKGIHICCEDDDQKKRLEDYCGPCKKRYGGKELE